MSRKLGRGDNGILNLSKAYRLQVGTGWQIDPGILHAPGSLVTYEPQVNSDVFGMFQSLVEGRIVPRDLLVKDVPKDKHDDLDFIIGMLDWDANVNPNFGRDNRVFPRPVRSGDREWRRTAIASSGSAMELGGIQPRN